MHTAPRSRPRRRALLAVAAVVLLGFVAAGPGASPGPAAAQAAPGYSVTATPTTGVIDGQAVDVKIAAPAGSTVLGGSARICRDGETYDSPDDTNPFNPGNCPNAGLSSSATEGGIVRLKPMPDKKAAIGTLRVGTGRVEWGPASSSTQFELTCDATHPCRLVVEIIDPRGTSTLDASIQVTFADSSPLAGCGGAASGALTTTGPDRFIDTWARWTREQCKAQQAKAASNAILTGEGLGLTSFAAGQSDLTYSAVGPAIPKKGPAKPRGSVSVPVGLNAVVIGALGGWGNTGAYWPDGLPYPFDSLEVTPAEMASLFGQATLGFDPTTITTRNPELWAGFQPLAGVTAAPQAPAGSDATSYLATRWFDTKAPDKWLTSVIDLPDAPRLTPRGIDDELSAAKPPFAISVLNLYSARANLKKAVATSSNPAAGNYSITWVLTDLATAEQLDIPTVALQNSRGEFVEPTKASIEAAVPTMERRADGTVMPRGAADAPGAYPLAFVEHAVVPTEPLVTVDCKPRTDSQALLASWLKYVTGPGQAQIDGLLPLTPDLTKVATASIAEVGTAKATGACGPKTDGPLVTTPPTTPPGTPPGVPPGLPSSGLPGGGLPGLDGSGLPASDLGSSGLPSGASGAAAGATRSSGRKSTEEAADAADSTSTRLPDLVGIRSLGGSVGVAALLGLALMGSVVGSLSSGRPLRFRRRAS